MATIKDVARQAGVSVCTVSRTLSGKGYLKEETRERVLQAVRDLDYHQNKLAVSLKTGRTNALALIVPDVMNLYYSRLAKYVEQYAAKKGYMVYLCNSSNNVEREKEFIDNLCQQKVAGVIVTPSTNEHQHILKLEDAEIPYVYLNRNFKDDIEKCIRIDNFKGAYDCIEYLIRNGHTRIGAIFQSFTIMIYEERYAGMVKALKDRGIPLDKSNILFDVDGLADSHEKIEELLRKKDRPDAIFTSNDMLAFDVYRAAYNCGLRIPEDLSVVGYDNNIMAEKMIPSLTSYHIPAGDLAEQAVKYVDARIRGMKPKKFPIFEGRLIERCSVKLNSKGECLNE